MQGAHRLRLKGVVPYKELYQVPLIMYIPWKAPKRSVIGELNSSASLAATLLDIADLPVPEGFYPSLLPLLDQEVDNEDAYVFIEHYKAYGDSILFAASRRRALNMCITTMIKWKKCTT